MPSVNVTAYEIEHDLLPPVCVRCGQPTNEHMTRSIPHFDGRGFMVHFPGLYFAVFFAPPLLPWVLRRIPRVRLRWPLCAADQTRACRHERLARRIVLPLWLIGVLALYVYCAVELVSGKVPGVFITWASVLLMMEVGIGLGAWIGRNTPRGGMPLGYVHPAFAAALLEDRARDRVDNPDRRGGRGDVRDDYDDDAG